MKLSKTGRAYSLIVQTVAQYLHTSSSELHCEMTWVLLSKARKRTFDLFALLVYIYVCVYCDCIVNNKTMVTLKTKYDKITSKWKENKKKNLKQIRSRSSPWKSFYSTAMQQMPWRSLIDILQHDACPVPVLVLLACAQHRRCGPSSKWENGERCSSSCR